MVIYWPDDSFYKIISEMLCFHSTRLIPAQILLDLYHLLCRTHAPDHGSGSFSEHPTCRAPFPPELWVVIRVGHGVLIDRHCPPHRGAPGPSTRPAAPGVWGAPRPDLLSASHLAGFLPRGSWQWVGAKDGDENHPGAFPHSPKTLLQRS